HAGPIA
nr:Chain B, PEPTIDE FROM THE HIV-1 CAPSID PROTEIN [unidentified]1AWR_G Chain G, PEPTIDE FROM THE HIV-1 CAPSID PROTEIN [unidentified]1AWR_H Chain H, PEPTIDE FROM THE HIV-1 CAPSID PROTEIN [unidentified]1AWR_I Chain I, PEPTIDE FROM THE HIV-1 CAPSID PROTEIN [unidentified]1AWR_J Chain J, PEPTIDE FROM THE HIV-1 CAPSID PROTEIN [unidentified]1AWR_K Chain K, PEPTIDE FROM THE HIV-1 CAPSID PROTEIN [unidentified]1AWR_L Chain L, PEPTIDE FROM THE HIV-1 CAPSID PROTEIN [unidentified]1AWS_B Chain B, PEPTIDE 